MAINPNTTVRKNVSLPRDLAERIERFRTSRGLTAESDALRRLIEIGLGSIDGPEDLADRCYSATANGNGVGYVVSNILDDHPLVVRVNMDNEFVTAELKNNDTLSYDRKKIVWLLNDEEYKPLF